MCLYAQNLRRVEVYGSGLRTEDDVHAFAALVERNAATLRVVRYDTVLASVKLWSALRFCVHLEEFDSYISNRVTADSNDPYRHLYRDMIAIRATRVLDIIKTCRNLRVLGVQRLHTTTSMPSWQASLADALRNLPLSIFRLHDPSIAWVQLLGVEPMCHSLTELHLSVSREHRRSFGAIFDTMSTQLSQLKTLLTLTVVVWASVERSDTVWSSDSVTFLSLCGRSCIPEQ
jgi:hypothetical protein